MPNRRSPRNDINEAIGANIRAIRKQRGFTQSDLSRVLGITFQQLQKYEKGSNRLSAERLFLLHQHLGIPIHLFFTGLNQTEPAFPVLRDETAFKTFRLIEGLPNEMMKKKVLRIARIVAE